MENKKNLLFLLPIIVFVATFMIVKTFNNSSYALNPDIAPTATVAQGTKYEMTKKNMYSYHLITHHFNTFGATNAPGTKLIKQKGGSAEAVVYCATEGKTLSQSSTRKRYSLNSSKVNINNARKSRLSISMPYMYPYINLGENSNTANSLKHYLKDPVIGLGADYDKYHFDDLNVNEAITAAQAAIWNLIKGKKKNIYHSYRGTISYFSKFNSCNDYWSGKANTTEEEAWHSQGGCNSSSKFYKYVYSHSKTKYTADRINTLITWYVRLHYKSAQLTEATNFHFDLEKNDSSFRINGAGTAATLIAKFKTNMGTSNYSIIFKDENNNSIGTTPTPVVTDASDGDKYVTYTINNINLSVKQINMSVESTNAGNNIYYYIASSGQDFIGLEKTKFTNEETLSISRDQSGKIIIYKVGNTDKNVEITESNINTEFDVSKCNIGEGGKCLSNAKFELYYETNATTHAMTLIREIETNYDDHGDYDSDPELEETEGSLDLSSVVIENLPLGVYYLKETQPAYGYDLYEYGQGPVDASGLIKIELTSEKTFEVVVNNNKTKICIAKYDAQDGTNILDNAIYEIKDIDDNVLEEFRTSSQQGKYCLEGQLQTGSYLLQEIQAPTGYVLDTTKYHFIVGKGENDITSLAEDIGEFTPITPTGDTLVLRNRKGVAISKSDVTTGACVAGALLTIRDLNGSIVTDGSGNEIGKWVSTCDNTSTGGSGYNCVTGYTDYDPTGVDDEHDYICTERDNSHAIPLEPGTYTLTETMTEELRKQGYSSEAETVEFTVDANGNVTADLDMKDAPIQACIYKVSKDSKDPIAGAVFEIYPKGSDTPYRTITSSANKDENCLTKIPFGTYIVKEIKAPDGYEISSEEVEIEILDTKEKQEFYFEDEVIAPITSMENTKILLIISFVFMIFGIGLVGYYGFKKQN